MKKNNAIRLEEESPSGRGVERWLIAMALEHTKGVWISRNGVGSTKECFLGSSQGLDLKTAWREALCSRAGLWGWLVRGVVRVFPLNRKMRPYRFLVAAELFYLWSLF